MRFSIPTPPVSTVDDKEQLSLLVSWLFALAENLNIVLNNLGEDNFNPTVRKTLENLTERNNANDL